MHNALIVLYIFWILFNWCEIKKWDENLHSIRTTGFSRYVYKNYVGERARAAGEAYDANFCFLATTRVPLIIIAGESTLLSYEALF